MIELFARGKKIDSFEELLASYPASEFDSPYRSTVLLLDYWRSLENTAKAFEKLVGVDFGNQMRLYFEFSVPVQCGWGKASSTDLMLTGNTFAVAVEVKFREPPYETVSKWLDKGDKKNRKKVLKGWISLIRSGTGVSLTLNDIASLPYQCIHRTASVCSEAATSRYVAYQVFEPAKEGYYSQKLQALADLFQGDPTLSFCLIVCPFEPLEDYKKLLDLWDTGGRKLSSQVSEALKSNCVARFAESRLIEFT